MALDKFTEDAIIQKYAQLIAKDVEDLVHRHLNDVIRTQLQMMIQTATETATKDIARKLLEIAIADAGRTP